MQRVWRRLIILTLLFGGSLALSPVSAAPAKSPQWVRGVYVAESPVAAQIPAEIAATVAQARAREVGGVAVPATGSSMLPLYQTGTIMVIAPAAYNDLKRGQTVVYQNRKGRTVAHILVTKLRHGWRVTGLNNRLHDGEGVNADNLRGVVVDAFQPVSGTSVASR